MQLSTKQDFQALMHCFSTPSNPITRRAGPGSIWVRPA